MPIYCDLLRKTWLQTQVYVLKNCSSLCNKSEENYVATAFLIKKAKVCLKQKSFVTYSTKVEKSSAYWKNVTNVLFFLSFTEKIKIINDEVLIFSNIDLLSSLGGALGLFIGFSFFGCIGTLLDAIVDKCVAGSFKRWAYNKKENKYISP